MGLSVYFYFKVFWLFVFRIRYVDVVGIIWIGLGFDLEKWVLGDSSFFIVYGSWGLEYFCK